MHGLSTASTQGRAVMFISPLSLVLGMVCGGTASSAASLSAPVAIVISAYMHVFSMLAVLPWWHCLERTSTKIPNEFIQADGVIPVNIHGIEDAPKLKYLQTRGQGRPPAGQFQCVHSPRVRQSASSANIQYS